MSVYAIKENKSFVETYAKEDLYTIDEINFKLETLYNQFGFMIPATVEVDLNVCVMITKNVYTRPIGTIEKAVINTDGTFAVIGGVIYDDCLKLTKTGKYAISYKLGFENNWNSVGSAQITCKLKRKTSAGVISDINTQTKTLAQWAKGYITYSTVTPLSEGDDVYIEFTANTNSCSTLSDPPASAGQMFKIDRVTTL